MQNPDTIQFYYHPDNPNEILQSTTKTLHLVNGINNFSISKSVSIEQQNLLGVGNLFPVPNSAIETSISFDRSFICKDPLLFLTGSKPLYNSYLKYNTKLVCMKDLYLTNYSVGFSIGELPVINTKFSTFLDDTASSYSINRNANPFIASQFSEYCPPILNSEIPSLGSIRITGTCAQELMFCNNIFSFDYSLEIRRQNFYSVGSRNPTVHTIYPMIINFSINSKFVCYREEGTWPAYLADSKSTIFKTNDGYTITPTSIDRYYDFDILVSGTTQTIFYPIRCAKLVSSEIQNSSSTTPEIKKNFIGYYGV